MHRRRFIKIASGSAAGLIAPRELAAQDDDLARLDALQAKARQAGLEELGVLRGELYLAAGNADQEFGAAALKLCDGLAKDFLQHFKDRGFPVDKPKQRMLVVILADANDFASFLGENPGAEVRGIYDIDAGWLAIPDNRGGVGGPRADRANSIVLFHEGTHQLCFECGLLERHGDVPLFISEGLATYGETRRPDGRTRMGARNNERIAVLRGLFDRAGKQKGELLPVTDLLSKDDLLNQEETMQIAYAQAWAFIHMIMQSKEDQARFVKYLDAIRPRRNAAQRVADFEAHLGPAADLDERLLAYVTRLSKR